MQITLGGWVSTHYAGLACVDFPYCNGQLLPTLQWHNLNGDLITIHMLHRIGAMITAIYLGILAFCLMPHRTFRTMAIILLTLIVLQISLGILNIIWLRPVWIALIHQMVAILILLTVITTLINNSYMDNRYDFRTT
jgi:cytochrome c oxidase assembly protein subunit 15